MYSYVSFYNFFKNFFLVIFIKLFLYVATILSSSEETIPVYTIICRVILYQDNQILD